MALRFRAERRKPREKPKSFRFVSEKRMDEPKRGRGEEREFNYFGRKFESAGEYNAALEEEDKRLHGAAQEERDKILEEKRKAREEEAPKVSEARARQDMHTLSTGIEKQEKLIGKIDSMIEKVQKSNPTIDAIKRFFNGFNPMVTIFTKTWEGGTEAQREFYLISPWKLPRNFLAIFFHKPRAWKLKKLRELREKTVVAYDRMTEAFEGAEGSSEGKPRFAIEQDNQKRAAYIKIYADAAKYMK